MSRAFEIVSSFQPAGDQPSAIETLVTGLEAGLAYQTLLGVTGSGKTFSLAQVIARMQRPALILAPNKTLAAQLYGEMKEFFPKNAVEYFVSYYDYYQPEAYVPASDTYIEKDSAMNEHIDQMRLSATKAIMERRDTIIVATVSAIYGLGDPQSYLKMMLPLSKGELIDQRSIVKRLASLQYQRNEMDLVRGSYRVRGDVIDIFPAEEESNAVRVELFDDEISRLSYFDPLTGEVLQQVPRLTIYPKTHYVTPREIIVSAMDKIKEDLRLRLEELYAQNKVLEAQRLSQRTLFDLEMMNEMGYCSGIENYSRYLSGRNAGEPPPTLMEYLPKDAIVFIDESHVTVPQIGAMYRGDRARKETLVNYGFRLPSALDNRPLRFDEFEEITKQTIYVSATPGPYELSHSGAVAEQVVRPTGLLDPVVEVKPALHQVDDVLSEARARIKQGERVLVTTLTKRMSEDLTEYLAEHGIKVRYLHSDIDTVERMEILQDLRKGVFDVLIGINLLREGLDIPEVSLVAILDADKQGFLRSERSLIQTIGRAARNINGKAILYGDQVTDSMRKAMEETSRRREKQAIYNQKNGISPRSVSKKIKDILESSREKPASSLRYLEVEEEMAKFAMLSPMQLAKQLKKLEQTMHAQAKNLEFEAAAKTRDQLKKLREQALKGKA